MALLGNAGVQLRVRASALLARNGAQIGFFAVRFGGWTTITLVNFGSWAGVDGQRRGTPSSSLSSSPDEQTGAEPCQGGVELDLKTQVSMWATGERGMRQRGKACNCWVWRRLVVGCGRILLVFKVMSPTKKWLCNPQLTREETFTGKHEMHITEHLIAAKGGWGRNCGFLGR